MNAAAGPGARPSDRQAHSAQLQGVLKMEQRVAVPGPARSNSSAQSRECRREIGIRVALGAARSDVLTQIMKQGLQVTAIGAVIGLAGALAVNRLIASLLFGVKPTDTVTIAFVIATITAVAVVASWLPAWRASRLDPNVVLRDE